MEPGKKGYGRDAVLQLKRVGIKGSQQTVTLVLDPLPKLVGVNPFNERVDIRSDET